MSESFRGKNVVICGYDNNNNIHKVKVNKNGEIIVSNNSISDSKNDLINLLQNIDNKLNGENIKNNKDIFFGGNLINCKNLKNNRITNMVNVENYNYCNIFYEDESTTLNNNISIMGMLDNYCYYELDILKPKYVNNCRKCIYIKLNIVGIKEIYLENTSNETFEKVIASIYCY